MKKVLLLTNIPSPYRVDLFYYLQTHVKGYEFYVMYCSKTEDNRCWNLNNLKIKNTIFVKTKKIKIKTKYDSKYIYFPENISKKLSEMSPDIIIAWEYNPVAIMTMLWCKIHGKKYINLTDGTLYSERNINLIQKINRNIITKGCDAAIASSTKAKEKLEAWDVPCHKIFISLLTVDTSVYHKVTRKPVDGRLLYVGSMIERKGLDLLINALQYVKEEFCLHIVGNGTDKEIEELKNEIRRADLEKNIIICGYKEGVDLLEEYQNAQIFVFPTREDCFGLVLLEALCAEIPIISSKYADGAYDVIEEGGNGILIDPYNAKEFGNIINKVLNGEISLDGKADMIVKKFTFDEVSKGYIKAIDYVLRGKQ